MEGRVQKGKEKTNGRQGKDEALREPNEEAVILQKNEELTEISWVKANQKPIKIKWEVSDLELQ